jgi:hypothetical protein
LAGLLSPLLFSSSWTGAEEDIETAIQLAHQLYNDLYEEIALIIRQTINGFLGIPIEPIDLDVENGSGNYLFGLAGDTGGLSIDAATGVISGSPEAFGDFDFSAMILDQNSGQMEQQAYSLKVISNLYDRYLATEPFFYLPLNEASGTVAYDYSGNDFDCNYENLSVGNSTFPDGTPASSFDTSTSMIPTYSSEMYDLFDSEEGSLFAWVRAVDASFWSNGRFGAIYELAHGSQTLRLVKTTVTNQMSWKHDGNGTSREYLASVGGLLTWFHIGLTWSASNSRVRAYLNSEIVSELGAPSLIDGAINTATMRIGRYDNSGTDRTWRGNIAHFALWNRELSGGEVATICPAFLLG